MRDDGANRDEQSPLTRLERLRVLRRPLPQVWGRGGAGCSALKAEERSNHPYLAPILGGEVAERRETAEAGEGVFRRFRLVALAVLLLTPLTASASAIPPDADILATAERAFAEGIELRSDTEKARPAFARAAVGYDELWRSGHTNPELALNRARAHRLAGNLPAAIVALHEGLAVTRWDRRLQVELEDARAAVGYPGGDLAGQCRPAPPASIGTRASPVDLLFAVGGLWLLACLGVARFAMTRAPGWLMFSTVLLAGLAVLGVFWLQDYRHHERENELPLVVVSQDAMLRKGNADAYLPRLESKLPRGVEARKLTERGGWVQVRLVGGVVGWLPASSVLGAE